MAINVSCPKCSKSYTLAEKQLGKTVVCRDCDEAFVVEDEADRKSRRSRHDEDDRPRRDRDDDRDPDRARRRDRDEYDDERPRRDRDEDDRPRRRDRDDRDDRGPRRKKSSGSGLLLWGLIGGGVGLVALIGVVLLIVVLASGVFNRVTQDNFNKIRTGMTVTEVEAILGRGEEVRQNDPWGMGVRFGPRRGMNIKVLRWDAGKNTIVVFFVDGKVFTKGADFTGTGRFKR